MQHVRVQLEICFGLLTFIAYTHTVYTVVYFDIWQRSFSNRFVGSAMVFSVESFLFYVVFYGNF